MGCFCEILYEEIGKDVLVEKVYNYSGPTARKYVMGAMIQTIYFSRVRQVWALSNCHG